ncbi:MAG: type II toxin-antitoxin system RelE/ParE family toxin [Paracoccaceae bacterium]
MKKYNLRITNVADQDLDDAYAEGFKSWGVGQADRYYDGILSRFERICENPMMYQAADDVREGYRRSVYEKHSIYYVIDGDTVEVRAVVKRQDVSRRP